MNKKSILVFLLFASIIAGCESTKPGALLISEPLVILQNITGIVAIFLAVIELMWMLRVFKAGWWKALYGVGILMYAIHIIVYYCIVNAIRLNYIEVENQIVFLSNWSSVLRFHGVTLLATMEYLRFCGSHFYSKEK